jgi:CheY-like chemotaxis protein
MPGKILLIQPDPAAAKTLQDYFSRRGDQVRQIQDLSLAKSLLLNEPPDLVFLDLHIPGNDWLDFLEFARKQAPQARVILTNRHPNYRRELMAKERGAQVFLRMPFTPVWIEQAIDKTDPKAGTPPGSQAMNGKLPRIRLPMRVKITFPYVFLALIFAFGASFLVSRYILESFQERFTAQLVDVGQLTSDWMVQEEARLLETLRLLANTDGLAEAISERDVNQIQRIVLPVTVNSGEETVHILDSQGLSLLSLVHSPGEAVETYTATQGDESLYGLDFIQKVLQGVSDPAGDKFAGFWQGPAGDYFSIAGPVFDSHGQLAGTVIWELTGNPQPENSPDTLAWVTFYALDGALIASTLLAV